ncbi:ParB/RepB/Spo0J family partition protein [Cochlodiniinecator piscidefendens]|uniref:ParB/RepB/Spo0J family partition protein n=1 Tax=Cochlodiniinecator piscidefendens TaxID=2715756 RepID=UPI00140CCA20|nr:ParB/RepB/Spo0J family partition protein [Cochlodiniinecator piscidefendens]
MSGKNQERRGLGRGLSALMADVNVNEADTNSSGTASADSLVPIERIEPNPDQPRKLFSDDNLAELAESIREKGIIQPLVVRVSPRDSSKFEIIAGERRWRASQIAQLHELPVVIREFSDTEVLEIAIIENVQRADLNPVEEAMGYRQLMDRFGHTQDKVAKALSKSRSYIANLLRLLQLPEDVLDLLKDGALSAGHARALITTNNASELAKVVVAKDLSVRETERLVKKQNLPPKEPSLSKAEKDADTKALEGDLSANLGMKVSVDHKSGDQKGRVTISYKTLEELDNLCRLLSTTH